MKDRVFVSYSHMPSEAAVVRTELLPILVRLELDVFIDMNRLYPGADLFQKVGEAIRRSRAVILAASSASFVSDWCRKECIYAQTIKPPVPVVPFLIENVPIHHAPIEMSAQVFGSLWDRPTPHWPAVVADALQKVGVRLNRQHVVEPAPDVDRFSSIIHPSYAHLSVLGPAAARSLIDECKRRLAMRNAAGQHHINLALLLLHLGEVETACRHADLALSDTPEHGETRYLAALVASSLEPLVRARRERILAIERLLFNSVQFGFESGLPNILLAVIAREFYQRNGMEPPHGDVAYHLNQASSLTVHDWELRRLVDSLRRSQPTLDFAQYGINV